MSGEAGAAGWYRAYLPLALPALVFGFLASIAADRIVFVGWGFASALIYGLFLRRFWPRPPVAWRGALWLLCAGSFGWLAMHHYTELRLGLAALLPATEGTP